MRTLRKLGLLTVSAAMIFGMSSCIKSSNPGFQFAVSTAYILQSGALENARFTPVIQIYSNEAIQKVSVKSTNENVSLYGTSANTTYNTLWNLMPFTYVTDSIPNGQYTVTAANVEGETNQLSITFDVDKRLGELTEKTFTYKASEGIKATWDKATNATNYYLAVRAKGEKVWMFYKWDSNNTDMTNGTFTASWTKGTEIEVAIAAGYKSLTTIGPLHYITWGTDLEVPSED